MSDTDLDRSERERQYAERGKRLLEEFEGRKASISEQDRKEACRRLGIPYEQKPVNKEEIRREVKAIKEELASLAEKSGLRRRPKSFRHALSGNEKEEEKPILPSH